MAKSRRPRGTGSYDKINDAKGNVRFYRWRIGIYDLVTGKTHYKSIKAKTRAALDEKVIAWKEEHGGTGTPPPLPKRLTVRQWVEQWLAGLENKVAQNTLARYKNTVNRHILPHFGGLWLSKVTPFMLQTYFDRLKAHAPSTVATIRSHFRACFSKAVKYGILSRNPVLSTDPPRSQLPEIKVLDEDEVKRILEVAKNYSYHATAQDAADVYTMRRNYLVVLLAVASGMRQGEILGLTWPCVHGTQLEIKYSLQGLHGDRRILKSPKNGKPRAVVIPTAVSAELERWRQFQEEYAEKYKGLFENSLSLVFTNPIGHAVNGGNFTTRHYRAICKAAGIDGVRFHDLRHFWASSALAKGVPVTAVSEQLGHSSIDITLRRYTHVLKRSRDALRVMLDENPLFTNIGTKNAGESEIGTRLCENQKV